MLNAGFNEWRWHSSIHSTFAFLGQPFQIGSWFDCRCVIQICLCSLLKGLWGWKLCGSKGIHTRRPCCSAGGGRLWGGLLNHSDVLTRLKAVARKDLRTEELWLGAQIKMWDRLENRTKNVFGVFVNLCMCDVVRCTAWLTDTILTFCVLFFQHFGFLVWLSCPSGLSLWWSKIFCAET